MYGGIISRHLITWQPAGDNLIEQVYSISSVINSESLKLSFCGSVSGVGVIDCWCWCRVIYDINIWSNWSNCTLDHSLGLPFGHRLLILMPSQCTCGIISTLEVPARL